MNYSKMTWQRRKARLLQTIKDKPAERPMAASVWRQALYTCLHDWPTQKPQLMALWKVPPTLVSRQPKSDWQAEVNACLSTGMDQKQIVALERLFKPTDYELQISWPEDEQAGSVSLNGQSLSLNRPDFEYLYALADLQHQTPQELFSPKHVYQHVQTLFPKQNAPQNDEKHPVKVFQERIEQLLGKLEVNLSQASSLRWRNLLLSQALRYANGLDDEEHFELHSELRQHRDLLELMMMRYEKQSGLQAVDSLAARLYRFFVPYPEMVEIRHRLSDYVDRHMLRIYQELQQAQQLLSAKGCPQEILWGQLEGLAWQDATSEGYSLNAEIKLSMATQIASM